MDYSNLINIKKINLRNNQNVFIKIKQRYLACKKTSIKSILKEIIIINGI
jgi:hypothetical protein